MPFRFIDDSALENGVGRTLAATRSLALDCEAAGFHRYSDRLCLVQTTVDGETLIFDTLAYDPSDCLRTPLERPDVEVVMHGGDYDLRLLDRDLGVRPTRIFDTQIAAALLGEPSLGLQALLERHLGVSVSKKYQRADWAQRPLPEEMLEYAATDTRHLHDLADKLRDALEERGRTSWAHEEFALLEGIGWEESDEDRDPVARMRGARAMEPRQIQALRAALAWRDRIARERDRAPFRIAGDDTLIRIARDAPRSVEELAGVRGMNGRLARSEGADLLERLAEARRVPEGEIEVPRKPVHDGRGRPPPEIEALAQRLKKVRNRRAADLGMDRGTLLPNSALLEIAWQRPAREEDLRDAPWIRGWQVDVLWPEIAKELTH